MPNSSNHDIIDQYQFSELQDLLEDDFTDLVKTYMSDSLTRIQEMRDAFQIDDNAKGYDAAHTLKGASANLGARRLTELCYQMQEACRNQQISHQGALIEEIADELELVHQEINIRLQL